MKDKKEINPRPAAMFYACVLESLRKIAISHGYALAIHGSCASDMDIIAVRWTQDHSPPLDLVCAFLNELSRYSFTGENDEDVRRMTSPNIRFNTHLHYTIPIAADWYIDLCVIE
jgi:hypothetical protein